MDSSTPDALCAHFASDSMGFAALREFSESIKRDLPAMIEICVRPLEQGSDDAYTVACAAASMQRCLTEWTCSLERPRGREYFESRQDLGRHYRSIGLPRELVIAAFDRFREQLLASAISWPQPPDRRIRVLTAIIRELDLELALVLQGHLEVGQVRPAADEHLADSARLPASIGHALRTPLATIETSAYLIAQRLVALEIADPAIDRHLDKIRKHVQNCSGIISDLLGTKS